MKVPISDFALLNLDAPTLPAYEVVIDGAHRRVKVCTRCLRSGKIEKPAPQRKPESAA